MIYWHRKVLNPSCLWRTKMSYPEDLRKNGHTHLSSPTMMESTYSAVDRVTAKTILLEYYPLSNLFLSRPGDLIER